MNKIERLYGETTIANALIVILDLLTPVIC